MNPVNDQPKPLELLHRQHLECGLRTPDDTGHMVRLHPSYELRSPRW